MATDSCTQETSQRARFATGGVIVLAIAITVIAFALPGPQQRHYPERQPVRFWHMWTAEWKVVVERIVDRFNQSQDRYEVIPLSIPGSRADTKFLLAVAGGDPPDVMAQWNPVIPAWAGAGLLMPLDELMGAERWQAFQREAYPVALKIGSYDDHLYGLAVGINIFACYYRKDHLDQVGLDPADWPETLEDLATWGEQLHRFDDDGNLIRMGFMPGTFWRALAMYAPGFGGGFYDWSRGRLTLNTPANLRTLNYLVACRNKLGYENVLRYRAGLAASNTGGADWPFMTGAYSIVVDGQWRVEQIAKYAPELPYGTAPLPSPSGGPPLGGFANGNFMIIPVGSKQIDGAWEFVKFWSGLDRPVRAAEFYTWGGWMPLSPAIAEAPIYRKYVADHPQFQTFVDVMPSENIHPLPPVPYQVYLSDRIARAEDRAFRGIMTPAEALAELRDEVAREVARQRELGYDW